MAKGFNLSGKRESFKIEQGDSLNDNWWLHSEWGNAREAVEVLGNLKKLGANVRLVKIVEELIEPPIPRKPKSDPNEFAACGLSGPPMVSSGAMPRLYEMPGPNSPEWN